MFIIIDDLTFENSSCESI